jgi:hypothetical protein
VQPLVGAEEERPVQQDRSADRVAELVARERRLLVVEVVLRVQTVVAVELEHRPVQPVGAGLGRGVDDAAGVMAELRAEAVGQHLELTHRFHAEHVPRGAARLAELIVQVGAVQP